MIVDGRIGNINALRRRAPHSWPRSRDITSQTRTRNAAGADATTPHAGASTIQRSESGRRVEIGHRRFHSRDALRLDLEEHAYIAFLVERVLVDAQIEPRQLIDVLVGSLFGLDNHFAAHF